MASVHVGAKRKRRVKGHCPNPLFVRWMEEWRDDARERGIQSQYAYTKALNSLKKYPLPLSGGQEAKLLDHIGEKLAKMLDKKLAEHRANEGHSKRADSKPRTGSVTSSLSPPPSSDSSSRNISSAKVGSKRKERATTASSHTVAASPHLTDSSDKGPPKPKKRKNTVREYIPAYRSGPYAVLIALYNTEQAPTWRGYLTKAELITAAQPYCDTSFTVPDDGSYYTAWSSVSQIEKKGLILRTGHPPKFSLTDAGVSLALQLLQGNVATSKITPTQRDCSLSDQEPSSSSRSKSESARPKPRALSKTPSPPSKHYGLKRRSGRPGNETNIIIGPEESPLNSPQSDFTDTYSIDDCEIIECDTRDTHNGLHSESLIKASPPLGSTCPPLTPHSSNTHQPTTHYSNIIALSDSDASDIEIVPLAERIAKQAMKSPSSVSTTRPPPLCSSTDKQALTPSQMAGLAALKRFEKQKKSTSTMSVQPLVFDLTETEDPPVVQPQTKKTVTQSSKTKPDKGKSSTVYAVSMNNKSTSSKAATTTMVDKRSIPPSHYASTSKVTLPSTKNPETIPPQCSSGASCVLSDASSSTNKAATDGFEVDLSSPEFTLKPGQFEVVLCVDNSESSASRNSRVQFRGVLLSELGKNGVQFDVRKLNVGDFTWIAREKVQPKAGCLGLPQSREVVLEYIVERKRMDDLAGSIIDGRFNEQKFRLSQCGVAHPIYLVEEFADSTHLKLPERSLNQAIANTQIISGFFVKRTRDIRESVAYLTIMTRALQRKYAGKTIKAHSRDTIIKFNKINRKIKSSIVHSMPFLQFNEASVKTKVLSVYEMFGRHLVQLPGFSVDKAAAVLEKYPTVSHLRDAYQNCLDNNEREKLLCEVRAGPSKRRIGPQLSSMVYSLYWRPS